MRRLWISVSCAPAMSGCSLSPSLAVVGAYFPDWMFCLVGALVLTVAVYVVLGRLGMADSVGPPAVLYPTLLTLFALIGWLIFFRY